MAKKSADGSLLLRATTRSKEVAEAKTKFHALERLKLRLGFGDLLRPGGCAEQQRPVGGLLRHLDRRCAGLVRKFELVHVDVLVREAKLGFRQDGGLVRQFLRLRER